MNERETRPRLMRCMTPWWMLPVLTVAGCECESTDSTTGTGGSHAAGGGGGAAVGGGGAGGAAGGAGGSGGSGGSGGTSAGGAGGSGGQSPAPVLTPITDRHRFIDGQMFGGWGPHLGHLVRARASTGSGNTLWFVDDYCAQPGDSGTGCDVLHDHTLGYFELTDTGWQERATVALPGQVQQNTGTIVAAGGETTYSYGVDVTGHVLQECAYSPTTGPAGCSALPFTLPASSNYLGAALSPQGYRLVWWTEVVDGGGGSFHYVIDYGGGWNGPRSGGAGGYNDASYINIAFGGSNHQNDFTMHVQLVSGLAPNWGFHGGVGYGDMSTTDPVTWSMALSPANGSPIVSTNDVWTDPDTNDTHLIARSEAGEAVYYHRPSDGTWSAPLFMLPATYRARFVLSEDRLVLVYGPNAGDLAYRVAAKSDRPSGSPIAWAGLAETLVALPASFGAVLAIYPESPAYQDLPASGVHVALVGATAQNEVLHVAIEPE